jgi:formate C-acetyltransferase
MSDIRRSGRIKLPFSRHNRAGVSSDFRKVAMLARAFAQIGCQQLQLNSLNVDTLRDAKLHPERHKNMIVRVWDWSGYFCELAPEYQDHIVARHVYA